MNAFFRTAARALLPVVPFVLLAGCEPEEEEQFPVPSAEDIRAHYEYGGEMSVEISGNVAQISVTYDPTEFERGGDLWAKAFPYIFIFAPGTREAFEAHRGLGGVRVIALHPNGEPVAQALLSREVLTQITWQEAINTAGRARQEGTERPGRMRDLVRWGEDHTEFEYNPDYIQNP